MALLPAWIFATVSASILWLRPELLVAGATERAYAPYGPDFTPLASWFFLGSAVILVFGIVTVVDAVWRVKDPAARTLMQKLMAFASVVVRGVLSDSFAKVRVGLSKKGKTGYLVGWLLMCLLGPSAWAATQDTPYRWAYGIAAALATSGTGFYVLALLRESTEELRARQRGET